MQSHVFCSNSLSCIFPQAFWSDRGSQGVVKYLILDILTTPWLFSSGQPWQYGTWRENRTPDMKTQTCPDPGPVPRFVLSFPWPSCLQWFVSKRSSAHSSSSTKSVCLHQGVVRTPWFTWEVSTRVEFDQGQVATRHEHAFTCRIALDPGWNREIVQPYIPCTADVCN